MSQAETLRIIRENPDILQSDAKKFDGVCGEDFILLMKKGCITRILSRGSFKCRATGISLD